MYLNTFVNNTTSVENAIRIANMLSDADRQALLAHLHSRVP